MEQNNYRPTYREKIFWLCEDIRSEDDFIRMVLNPTHYFGKKEKSISTARKGNPMDLDFIVHGTVAALKSSPCTYCGVPFSGGIDRVDSNQSYPEALKDGKLVPCCSDCNLHISSWRLDDVLVHGAIVILHLGENYDRMKQLHSIYTTPTDGMMTYISGNRLPLKCMIGGVEIMFPSEHTMKTFGVIIPPGTTMLPVTVQRFKEWREGLTPSKQQQIRDALGIRSLLNLLLSQLYPNYTKRLIRT
mmetsp:Transcript_23104/g.33007  ORF Transcript_23104/g.33007 Transcript_23104/m.33007 type:complete len:245 (+) Transcript_23104:181-915(+)